MNTDFYSANPHFQTLPFPGSPDPRIRGPRTPPGGSPGPPRGPPAGGPRDPEIPSRDPGEIRARDPLPGSQTLQIPICANYSRIWDPFRGPQTPGPRTPKSATLGLSKERIIRRARVHFCTPPVYTLPGPPRGPPPGTLRTPPNPSTHSKTHSSLGLGCNNNPTLPQAPATLAGAGPPPDERVWREPLNLL